MSEFGENFDDGWEVPFLALRSGDAAKARKAMIFLTSDATLLEGLVLPRTRSC